VSGPNRTGGRRRPRRRRARRAILPVVAAFAATGGAVVGASDGEPGGETPPAQAPPGPTVRTPAADAPASTAASRSGARTAPATTQPPAAGDDGPRLTLRQLVGQRLVASFRGTTTPPRQLVARIRRGELAGVILFAENGPTIASARRVAARLQRIPRPPGLRDPLLIMIDQEGGPVRRLRDAPPARSALETARAGDPAAAERSGTATARALRRAGVNVDLAPVADTPRAGSALLRERRTFGGTARQVRAYAARFARGLVAGGVQATAKHFPGFGAATVNTDDAPAEIRLSRQALRDVDRPAFRSVVDNGAKLVMLSNAVYPALDARRPATLSRAIATTELRGSFGFDGVSVTDDLEASALRRHGGPGRLATLSASAGVDLLLFGRTYRATEQAAAALQRAVRAGRISRRSLEQGAERVLALRRNLPKPPR